MKFRLAGDGDEEALVDLQTWLSEDPGTARLEVSAVGGRGPTMNTLEALDILLGNAVDIANFALAYVTWRSVRNDGRSGSGGGDGSGVSRLVHGDTTVDIGHLSPEELAELLRRLDGNPPPAADA
ncbi:effector-associated constant component EACC1 [Streptomyces bacillaris]|uniref:effector-associated constant component EACC1 n=1 Tax=Streptomyces bacillaris TaxID=68179 RepID=UPI003664CC70